MLAASPAQLIARRTIDAAGFHQIAPPGHVGQRNAQRLMQATPWGSVFAASVRRDRCRWNCAATLRSNVTSNGDARTARTRKARNGDDLFRQCRPVAQMKQVTCRCPGRMKLPVKPCAAFISSASAQFAPRFRHPATLPGRCGASATDEFPAGAMWHGPSPPPDMHVEDATNGSIPVQEWNVIAGGCVDGGPQSECRNVSTSWRRCCASPR